MKKLLFFISLISLFAACNIPDDAKNVSGSKLESFTKLGELNDSVKAEAKPNAKPLGKPLLIARGSEPGWYAEFSAGHLRLLINNGTDSLHFDHDFSGVASDKGYKKTIIDVSNDDNGTNVSLVINIEPKPCTEMSGSTTEKTISIRYNNQNLKGCAGSR